MHHVIIQHPSIILIGQYCRTNNAAEMNPSTAKIGKMLQSYFQEKIADRLLHRRKPGTTYCVYTEYESDANGEYTYFVGEEVEAGAPVPEGLKRLVVPAQTYAKFTNGPGNRVQMCIQLWQKVWSISTSELGGARAYTIDFEVYDQRAVDPEQTTLDLYISLT
jgi:predicted transcriptional regulator YdeE